MQIQTTAAPQRLKKRSFAKLGTATIATVAGVALAATAFQVTQEGWGSFTPGTPVPDPTPISEETYSVSALELGELGTTALTTADAPTTSFTISNDSDERGEARALGVTATSDDDGLLDVIEVSIWRVDPTGAGGDPNHVYTGPLSGFGELTYMGDVVARGSQTFKVWAWVRDSTTQSRNAAFTIQYGVYGYSDSDPVTPNGPSLPASEG